MPPKTQTRTDSSQPRDRALAGFRCAQTADGGGSVSVHLSGELDLATAPELERTVREAELNAHLVVLDLRELEFMDCAGLRVILDAAERARQQARRLIVVRGQAWVDDVFSRTGTANLVEISDHDPRQPPTDSGAGWLAAADKTAPC